MANAADVGAHLMAGLQGADGQASAHRRRARPRADDRRRAGARSADQGARRPTSATRSSTAASQRGLLVLGAGKNAIRFSPPLVLTREQADTARRIFDEALTEVESTT